MSGDQSGVLRAGVRAPGDLEAVLHAVPIRISLVGADGRVRFANAAAARHFRTPDLLGRSAEDLIGLDAVTAEAPYVSAVLAGDAQRHYRRSVRPDGTDRYDEIRLLPVPDGYVVCARDATASVRAQHALRTNRATASVLAEQHRLAAELDDAVVSGIEAARHELAQAVAQDDEESAAPWVAAAAQRLARVLISLGSTAVNLQREETAPVARVDAPADPADDTGSLLRPPPSGLDDAPLRSVIDAVPIGLAVVSATGDLLLVNAAATPLVEVVQDVVARSGGEARAGRPVVQEVDRDGVGRVRVRCVPPPTGGSGEESLVVIAEDVSAEAAAGRALSASQEQVATLHEQRQVAEELHASVLGQLDTASRLLTGVPDRALLPHVLDGVERAAADLRSAAAVLCGESIAPEG